MRSRNWSICVLSVCIGGALAACGRPQPPVAEASLGAIPAAGDLAQPLSTFSGETFSTKKINSYCQYVEVGGEVSLSLTYYVAGKSSGPYPGTFLAKGFASESFPSYRYNFYSYYFHEKFKVTSHRRQFYGVVRSRREFSVQGCDGYSVNGFSITGARYGVKHSSSGRTAITLTPQSFSESFH
jgi:hypothetical protein